MLPVTLNSRISPMSGSSVSRICGLALVSRTGVQDFIISNRFVSMVLAQISEDADDLFVGVGPAADSSVDGLGPAWLHCEGIHDHQPGLFVFRNGGAPRALAINRPVPVNQSTWSEIKALYR